MVHNWLWYHTYTLTYHPKFMKSCAICLSSQCNITSSPGLNFKCMRNDGPPRYQSVLASFVLILTQRYPTVKLQRRLPWLIWIIWTQTTKKVCSRIPNYVYVPLYDKINSSSRYFRALICHDNLWYIIHRETKSPSLDYWLVCTCMRIYMYYTAISWHSQISSLNI